MDSIILLLRKKLQIFNCIENYRETLNGCEIKTKEGIKYACYFEKQNDNKIYYLYNRHYEKRCKLDIKTINSKYFDENIIPDIFENDILQNEISYKAFKEGMKAFKNRNTNYDIFKILSNEQYLKYSKQNKMDKLVFYIWNKGYEFASRFPDPDVVYNQYEYLRKRALEDIDIDTIREFMIKNKDIHIYFDEKTLPEKAKELDNVKEIEYSYGHIVAKAKTYNLKMNMLPLDGEILVFDTEGINEIAKCNVDYYSIEYEDKALSEMTKSVRNFDLEKGIEKEKDENEQEE